MAKYNVVYTKEPLTIGDTGQTDRREQRGITLSLILFNQSTVLWKTERQCQIWRILTCIKIKGRSFS